MKSGFDARIKTFFLGDWNEWQGIEVVVEETKVGCLHENLAGLEWKGRCNCVRYEGKAWPGDGPGKSEPFHFPQPAVPTFGH